MFDPQLAGFAYGDILAVVVHQPALRPRPRRIGMLPHRPQACWFLLACVRAANQTGNFRHAESGNQILDAKLVTKTRLRFGAHTVRNPDLVFTTKLAAWTRHKYAAHRVDGID